jgi:mono/diheme cytochrome c family protein
MVSNERKNMFTPKLSRNAPSKRTTLSCAALVLGISLAASSLTASAQSATTPDSNAPTYLRDALPIFMGKCYRCHNDQSTVLPNWTDYKTAFAHRLEIKRRVWDSWKGNYYKQTMPAGDGSECLAMTENERLTLKQWADDGGLKGKPLPPVILLTKTDRIQHGKELFNKVCAACHQPDGRGIPGKFPPLAGSDFLNADRNRAVNVLLHGRQGEITVNGQTFNNSMPMFPLSDSDIASALTYVYSSFGNSGKDVTPDQVKTLRAQPYQQQKAVASAPQAVSQFE